jgi:hypothetical protein
MGIGPSVSNDLTAMFRNHLQELPQRTQEDSTVTLSWRASNWERWIVMITAQLCRSLIRGTFLNANIDYFKLF